MISPERKTEAKSGLPPLFNPYTSFRLRFYDFWVGGVSNHLVWRCPTREIANLYRSFATGNHLDVGVGTGFFLDQCQLPSKTPRVVLLDLSEDCLAAASHRLRRYRPTAHRADILEPVRDLQKFDSISVSYLLHCLPGPFAAKAVVFDHLGALLNEGGTLFGATVLHGGVPRTAAARMLMSLYNGLRIFSNEDDSLDGLRQALAERFASHRLETVGSVALFSAQKPRSHG